MNDILRVFLESIAMGDDRDIKNIKILGVLENINEKEKIQPFGDNSFEHETIGEIIVSFDCNFKMIPNNTYNKRIVNFKIQRRYSKFLEMALDEIVVHNEYIKLDIVDINIFGYLRSSKEIPFYMATDGWELIEFDSYYSDKNNMYYYQLEFSGLALFFIVLNPLSKNISQLEKVINFKFSERLLEAISKNKISTILTKNLNSHFSEEWINEQLLIYEVEK